MLPTTFIRSHAPRVDVVEDLEKGILLLVNNSGFFFFYFDTCFVLLCRLGLLPQHRVQSFPAPFLIVTGGLFPRCPPRMATLSLTNALSCEGRGPARGVVLYPALSPIIW